MEEDLTLFSDWAWWNTLNTSSSSLSRHAIFYALSASYALVSSIALIQLIRIHLRVPEYGWTTQKIFHLMNFLVNGVRALVFGLHTLVFLLHPKVLILVLLDLPGLLFFSTYTLLVLFWAEIYHQARSLSTDRLKIVYISINAAVYFVQPIPNQKIHWRSLEGLPNRGAVRFYPKGPSSCMIELTVSYEVPQLLAPVASALQPFLESLLQRGLERFVKFAKATN